MGTEKEKEFQDTLSELNAVFQGLTKPERAFVDENTEIQSRLKILQNSGKGLIPEGRNVRLACFYPAGAHDIFQKLLKKLHNAAIIVTREEWRFEIVSDREMSFDNFDDRSARASALSAGAEAVIILSAKELSLSGDVNIFCRAISLSHAGSLFHYADLMLDMAGHFHVPVAARVRECDVARGAS